MAQTSTGKSSTEGMALERGKRAADITMEIKGAAQGAFKGGSPKKDRKDKFDLWEVYHSMESPRDNATGQASGRRVHNNIVVAGETTGGVAMMYTAIFHNETLNPVKIDFYRTDSQGKQSVYYTIELKNAMLVELESLQDETGRPNFRAQFSYQEITLTWKEGNLTANDTWHGTT